MGLFESNGSPDRRTVGHRAIDITGEQRIVERAPPCVISRPGLPGRCGEELVRRFRENV